MHVYNLKYTYKVNSRRIKAGFPNGSRCFTLRIPLLLGLTLFFYAIFKARNNFFRILFLFLHICKHRNFNPLR